MPAEQVLHLGGAFGLTLREEIDELVHGVSYARVGLPGQLADVEVSGHGRAQLSRAARTAARVAAGFSGSSTRTSSKNFATGLTRPSDRIDHAGKVVRFGRARGSAAASRACCRLQSQGAAVGSRCYVGSPPIRGAPGCFPRMLSTRFVRFDELREVARARAPWRRSSSRVRAIPHRPAIEIRRATFGLSHGFDLVRREPPVDQPVVQALEQERAAVGVSPACNLGQRSSSTSGQAPLGERCGRPRPPRVAGRTDRASRSGSPPLRSARHRVEPVGDRDDASDVGWPGSSRRRPPACSGSATASATSGREPLPARGADPRPLPAAPGNSPTRPVTRSALARCAACVTRSRRPPGVQGGAPAIAASSATRPALSA